MAGSLESVVLKLFRANEHFVSLVGEPIGAGNRFYTDYYRLTPKPDADGLGYEFYIGDLKHLDPDRWGIVFGDFLFDLRSALDHLVYQLHVAELGAVSKKVERHSAFPIQNDEPVDDSGVAIPTSEWRQIKRLGDRERALIERLQPYNARNDPDETIRYGSGALASLNKLNNIDKHRRLHVICSAINTAAHPVFSDEYGFATDPLVGPVESGAKVDHWRWVKEPPRIARQVDVHSVFVQIALDEPGERDDVIAAMQTLQNRVIEVIGLFAYRFPSITFPAPI